MPTMVHFDNTLLAGAAVSQSPVFGVAPNSSKIGGLVIASHAGTLALIAVHTDGTEYVVESIAVAAGAPAVFSFSFPVGAARVKFTNGATLLTKFQFEVYELI